MSGFLDDFETEFSASGLFAVDQYSHGDYKRAKQGCKCQACKAGYATGCRCGLCLMASRAYHAGRKRAAAHT